MASLETRRRGPSPERLRRALQIFVPVFIAILAAIALHAPAAAGQDGARLFPESGSDIPKSFTAPVDSYDYVRREVMIPMRDGVKLFTVILIPKGAHDAPMVLTRTPYNASRRTRRANSPHMLAVLSDGDDVWVNAGYIRVFQDVRGKYKSEGDYIMTRPVRGPLNPTNTDHATDAYDTIDWLVKNVPESNGRVGMIGSSYEGFTVAMALLDPHPALKVAAPESPMVDGWMGDDWFHYGAFRQTNLDYTAMQTSEKSGGSGVARGGYDDYDNFLRAGSTGDYVRAAGLDKLPWVERMMEHPAYDAFWQGQALDKLVAAHPSNVPTLWLQGLWDQEDMWGAIHCYSALKAAGHGGNNHLVLGPWYHSQVNYQAYALGPLKWEGDTARQFRRDVLLPFFEQYLRPGAPKAGTQRVLIYNTGENRWDRFDDWPLSCEKGCASVAKPIYLQAGFGLGFDKPAAPANTADTYVSDPAKPIPFVPRPVRFSDHNQWATWLVSDQRAVADRTDVLVYETPVLDKPVRVSGVPVADLYASTTGTDSDWVVKLIDVYPTEVPRQPEMGGYELPISMDIFRGRYRDSFEHPSPIPAGKPQRYRFTLPAVNHVFQPGHRIMVQIQSSWFPLYDRNPQTYVENIFFAKPADYVKATQSIYRSRELPSSVWLPVVE